MDVSGFVWLLSAILWIMSLRRHYEYRKKKHYLKLLSTTQRRSDRY